MNDPLEIRPYRPGDATAILRCWNAVMPEQDGRRPRTQADWDWEFERTPHGGKRIIVAALPDGSVVGQYAALPYRAVAEGKPVTIDQIVDLVVLPEYRRRLERPGLFVHLGRRFHDEFCGAGKDILTYGYPVPAWRMGQKYLTYEMVRDTDMLFRECHVAGFRPRPDHTDEVEVVEVARFGAQADALWAKVAPEITLGLVRDGSYLDWRYADHPERCYTLLLARDRRSGAPRGLAVFRVGSFIIEGAGLCVEWLVPGADLDAEQALLGRMEALTVARGAPVLATLFNQQDPRFLRWQRHGFLVAGTRYFLVMTTFHYPVTWLREAWYYTLGDTDLV